MARVQLTVKEFEDREEEDERKRTVRIQKQRTRKMHGRHERPSNVQVQPRNPKVKP